MYDKIKAIIIFKFFHYIQYLNSDNSHLTHKIQMTHTTCIKHERRMGDSCWRLFLGFIPTWRMERLFHLWLAMFEAINVVIK